MKIFFEGFISFPKILIFKKWTIKYSYFYKIINSTMNYFSHSCSNVRILQCWYTDTWTKTMKM